MVNERYKPVKKFLYEVFLAEKQQYPQSVLVTKRFMANFTSAAADKPARQQQQKSKSDMPSDAGSVFVSPDKTCKGTWPVCHACGKQHNGGWNKCNQISKTVRTNIGKLVKAGAFDNKSGDGGSNRNTPRTTGGGKPTNQKRGTVSAVVKEKDDGEETEAEEDGMPNQEHLLQMLGMSTTLVDNTNTIEKQAVKAEGC